ncbi:MAG: hypothetical protein IPP17_00670 [Bacteroidetes bacterium]|nr:hypothetical protein [Bacteroidota bacterium]
MLALVFGEEDMDHPGTYKPAHIDVIPLLGKLDKEFSKLIIATLSQVNKGWRTTVRVSANGHDFVDLDVVKANAGEIVGLKAWRGTAKASVYFH